MLMLGRWYMDRPSPSTSFGTSGLIGVGYLRALDDGDDVLAESADADAGAGTGRAVPFSG